MSDTIHDIDCRLARIEGSLSVLLPELTQLIIRVIKIEEKLDEIEKSKPPSCKDIRPA